MTSICQSCGKNKENLEGCSICGARVCSDCLLEVGCKLCKGKAQG